MPTDAKKLLNLFDRPTEPVFMPKGNKDEVFDVPENYLVDRYRPLQSSLTNRWGVGDEAIKVKKIRLPDITSIQSLDRRENFSLFIPHHAALASRLVDIFMAMKDTDDLLSASVYCRDRVNPFLFNYALSVALLHREDTKHLEIPPLCQVFPEKFVDSKTFAKAREEVNIVNDSEDRIALPIPMNFTASDLEPEHRVAYFREDLGVNLHHHHWHLVYPSVGDINIVKKDRRGELFYYMHQQVIARYNIERFCNLLPRVRRLADLREPIQEGYFPKMDSQVASRNWPARKAYTVLADIEREAERLQFDIHDLELWSDRIYTAIHNGFAIHRNGEQISLTGDDGIDVLGNLVESSALSINKNLYGSLHNFGHNLISYCHDPDNRHLETFGVMGDPATAMRDPIFYRWHACIDNIFSKYKNTLPPYTYPQLDFPEAKIAGLELTAIDEATGRQGRNQILTYWQESDVNFSNGLDFSPRGTILARFTHLQHSSFTYKITIDCASDVPVTVRIFMAPKFNERGLEMPLIEQRRFFIEMDRFVKHLKQGTNVVTRKSSESSVTIPFERTFRKLSPTEDASPESTALWQFCGCGWPQHMLVPKGTCSGYNCQLFVMITDYRLDKVEGSFPETGGQCDDSSSFCGLRDRKYPDKRPMGYPLDRKPRDGVDSIYRFLTPNMGIQDIQIKFEDRLVKVHSSENGHH